MLIYVDYQGTYVGNARYSDEACAEAVMEMMNAGHQVRACSSAPGPGQVDKCAVLAGDLSGIVLIDDEPGILAAAARKGAITVPAARLLELAAMLGGGR